MSRTLTSLIKEHLLFGTGSRDKNEQQRLLDSITADPAGEDFKDLMDWLEIRVMDECQEIKLLEKS